MNKGEESGKTVARPTGAAGRSSRGQSAFAASILLAASSLLSSILGLGRGKFIAWLFGAGMQTDAYNAAFRLPDLMSNFLVGGAVSITFVTLLNRYREQGQPEEGERVLFTVLNLMTMVLAVATLVLMIFAAPLVHWMNPGFTAEKIALCAHITRILLPAQIFLFIGGVLGSTLLVRKQFLYQAATPILYNLFIIAGGILLHKRFGISSLAIGATAGFFFGSMLTNALGAASVGVRYQRVMDLHHPGFKVWLQMTLPLMLGFGLPFLDVFISGFFASHGDGDITRLANAKQLFNAPMSMLAQAAGVASMPFFAQIWARGKQYEFAMGIADAVSRAVSLGLLAASAMMALAPSIVGLIFGGGRFTEHDVQLTALFFTLYTLSLAFWAAQSIYARAFYAAGITWLPLLASTVVVVLAAPAYQIGYRHFGAGGLALASDAGIAVQAMILAVLLHKRRMVSMATLEFREMGRCLMAALVAGGFVWLLCNLCWNRLAPLLSPRLAHANRLTDLAILAVGGVLWLLLAKAVLEACGSVLPEVMMRKLLRRK
jgi:putative peptidoglycan lipid II flippase